MNPLVIVYLVSLAAFLGPFTQTIYAPLLPQLQGQLHTSQFLVNLTIGIFTLVLAAMQLVYGPLVDRRGRRKLLVPGMALYVVASLGCALSGSIGALLAWRAVQAAGIAVGSVVAVTVIGDLFDGPRRGRAMGTFQMMVAMGAVVGPFVGGFAGSRFGYPGVFFILAGTGLALLLLQLRFVPETRPAATVARRLGLRDFGRLLAHPTGASVIGLGFVQYFAYYSFLVFLPDVLTRHHGLTPQKTGLVFLPLSCAIVVGSYFGGRLEGGRSLVVTSSLNVVGLVLFLLVATTSLPALIGAAALFGLCLGLSLPVQTTLLAGAFVEDRATAIGVYNLVRYLGMAAGPLLGSVLYKVGAVPLLFGTNAALFAAVVVFAQRMLRPREASGTQLVPPAQG